MTYDNRNRPSSSSWSANGQSVTTAYDAASRITSIVSNSGETTVAYGYDDANRQVWEDQTLSGHPTKHVETLRDADGNRSDTSVPGYILNYYDYTQRGQLAHIQDSNHTTWFTYTYDMNGNMTKRQDNYVGVNDSVNVSYDQLNRPTMWENTGSGDVEYARSWYNYDNLSRETTTWRDEQAGKGERFIYDVTNQMLNAYYNADGVANGGAPSNWSSKTDYAYTADKLNRSSVTTNGVAASFGTASQVNQYETVGGQPLSYDSNLNLTGYAGGTYSYDAENHLMTASNASFVYDGLGRCVKRTVNGVVTLLTYDGWKPIVEVDNSNNFVAWNIYGFGADELLWRGDAVYGHLRYHTDKEGNITALLDYNGNKVESYTYDAFGKPSFFNSTGQPLSSSTVNNRFLFTGREWFPQLGIYDYRHRYYYPDLGRFLQMDPTGFDAGDMNLFRYCDDDPVDKTDPTGTQERSIDGWNDGAGPSPVVSKEQGAGGSSGQQKQSQPAGNGGQGALNSDGTPVQRALPINNTIGVLGMGSPLAKPTWQTKGNMDLYRMMQGRGSVVFREYLGATLQAMAGAKLHAATVVGYSRGAAVMVNQTARFHAMRFNLVGIDPVRLPFERFNLSSNVTAASDYYQQNPRSLSNPFTGAPFQSATMDAQNVNMTGGEYSSVNHNNIVHEVQFRFYPGGF